MQIILPLFGFIFGINIFLCLAFMYEWEIISFSHLLFVPRTKTFLTIMFRKALFKCFLKCLSKPSILVLIRILVRIQDDFKVQKLINISNLRIDFAQILTEPAYGDPLQMIQFWWWSGSWSASGKAFKVKRLGRGPHSPSAFLV